MASQSSEPNPAASASATNPAPQRSDEDSSPSSSSSQASGLQPRPATSDRLTATTTSSSQQLHPSSSLHSRRPFNVKRSSKPDSGPRRSAVSQNEAPESPVPSYPLFPGDKPWSQRSWAYELIPFRGMYYDLRRRQPFLKTDWTSALEPRNWWTIVNSVIRMYFINLMPAIAYVLDMYIRTDGSYGINEVILASALAAIVFPIFSVQPLTFVGVTGLINLVNYTQYDIFVGYYNFDRINYLRIQAWSLIWAAAFHFVVAIFNICDFTRFITDITSETFGFYVGIVYIQKGIILLIEQFEPSPNDNATGWLSVTIAMLFTISVYFVSKVGGTSYLPFQVRLFISSHAFAAGCVFWTGFSNFPDNSLRRIPIERLPITRSWYPTLDRSWFIDFWNIELKYVFVGAPLGFLIMLLFYFDHNVSSVMAQARRFPVKTPAGFHWDFFLLGIVTLVSGFLGLPAPNGLVPQAPVHTETLSVFKQVDKPAGEGDSAKKVRQTQPGHGEPAVQPEKQQHVVNTRVVEQRFSHLVVGLLTLGTATRPLLVALGTMPRAVFAGVFILVGWSSIERNNITLRTLAIFRDRRMAPPDEPLSQVRRRKIALFVAIQWLFFGMTIAISETIAGIGFPVIITLLIPVRYFVVPMWFSPMELKVLDAPTSDADAVLASLGHESERVTGKGVEIALDTGIAGDLYGRSKKHDDGSSGDDDEDGSDYRGFQAGSGHDESHDEEKAIGGRPDPRGDLDEKAATKEELESAPAAVAGVGGKQSLDGQIEPAPAIGSDPVGSGLAAGVAAVAAIDQDPDVRAAENNSTRDTTANQASVATRQQSADREQPVATETRQADGGRKAKEEAALVAKQKREEEKRGKEAEAHAAKERKQAEKAETNRIKEEQKREKEAEKQRKKEVRQEEKRKREEDKVRARREAEMEAGAPAAAAAAVAGAGSKAGAKAQEDDGIPKQSHNIDDVPGREAATDGTKVSTGAPQIPANVLALETSPVEQSTQHRTSDPSKGDAVLASVAAAAPKNEDVTGTAEPRDSAAATVPTTTTNPAGMSWSNPAPLPAAASQAVAPEGTGTVRRGRRQVVAVENPSRGAGSPPPPVQWRATERG